MAALIGTPIPLHSVVSVIVPLHSVVSVIVPLHSVVCVIVPLHFVVLMFCQFVWIWNKFSFILYPYFVIVLTYSFNCAIHWLQISQACPVLSQASQQGLAVLMASAVVVLKHETSTLRQSHNFISIDFKFGVGYYVREVTSPAKFGLDPMSGRDATWGNMYCDFYFVLLFLYSST